MTYYTPFSMVYIHGLVTISYYLGFIPFRFKRMWNLKTGYFYWIIYRNMYQKVACIAIHLILVVMTMPMLYATFGPDDYGKMKVNSILDFTLGVFGAGVTWYFLYFVWFNQSSFLLLMQPILVSHNDMCIGKQHHKSNVKEWAPNLFAILLPIFNIFSSLYAFFEVNAIEIRKPEGIWSLRNIRGMAYVLLIVLFNIQHNFFQVITLRFREKTKLFCELVPNIQRCSSKSTQTVLREYANLDLYINQLNQEFGTWILISAVMAIPFLSQKFIELFKGSVPVLIGLLNIPFLIAEMFYLFMAAEGSFQIDKVMRNWLIRNARYLELCNNEMSVLVFKLSTEPISLRGRNFFVITNKFVGSVISLIITYAFIDQNNEKSQFTNDVVGNHNR